MFKVIEITEHYNRRGAVIRTDKREVFESDDLIETAKYRYANAKYGCWVTIPSAGMDKCVSLATENDGTAINFAEMFRLVEGDEAYEAVMSGDRDPVNEQDWIASK